jgi:hypothetical protein
VVCLLPLIEQTVYEGIKFSRIFEVKSSVRDYPALKEKSKTNLEKLVRSSSDWSDKDHTHQVTSRCAIAFARAKYGNDLILADFNLVVVYSIRQIAKFNSPPNFSAIRY